MIEEIVVKIVKETLENLMNAERQAFIEEHNRRPIMEIVHLVIKRKSG